MADRIRLRVLPSLLPQNLELENTGTEVRYRYAGQGDDAWITLFEIEDISATLEIGTVSTLGPNDVATVENVGTPQHAILNIGIPAGSDGLVQTLVEGNAMAVDTTDPNNPIVALSEPLYVLGAADGATDDTSTIQAIITTRSKKGSIVIPPGSYYVPGDLTIAGTATGPDAGGVRIEATGAVFSGGGKIIVDSCKRLTIVGLDAPSHVVHLRGAWKCRFEDMRIQSYVVGQVNGTGFSSCAWNLWIGGYTQAFIVHADMSSYCNHNTFIGVNIAGAAGQGFSGTTNYGIELNGNGNVQNLAFLACDVSYFNTATYRIGTGNTTGDVEIRFENCYFDDMWPNPAYGRNDVMVSIVNCHVAGKFIYPNQQRLRGQAKGAAFAKAGEYTMGWQSWATENLVPNGDLSLWNLTLGKPISNAGGATLELSGSGPYFRAQHASGTTMYAATVDLPFNANYCATVIMRVHSGASAQTITVGLDGKEFFSAAVGSDWTEVQVAPTDELTSGSPVTLTIASAAAIDIDIAYIGVHLGTAGAPLMLPQSRAARAAAMSGVPTPPTAVAVTNVSATTLNHLTYTVEGKVVTMSFSVNITPTAAGSAQTQVGIPLPVPSNFSSSSQAHGVSASSSGDVGSISADATNDRLTLTFLAASTSNRPHYGTCQYEIR